MTRIEALGLLDLKDPFQPEDLVLARKRALFKWHPDRHLNNLKIAEDMFKNVNLAVDLLRGVKVGSRIVIQVYNSPISTQQIWRNTSTQSWHLWKSQ